MRRKCSVTGCGRFHSAQGFCASHYQKAKFKDEITIKDWNRPMIEKVREKTKKDSAECWIWRGSRMGSGHPEMRVNGKLISAARVSYMAHHGLDSIEPGMRVFRSCNKLDCVNPEHLYLNHKSVTNPGGSKKQDKCKRGHPMSEAYVYGDKRVCRKCQVMRTQAWRKRNTSTT